MCVNRSPVEVTCRSRMNIPLRVGGANGNEAIEKRFLDDAGQQGLVSLKGHRYV